jgi:hypothetical protein
VACIGIHSFAVQHKTKERQQNSDYNEFEPPHDNFIDEGLTDSELSSFGSSDQICRITRQLLLAVFQLVFVKAKRNGSLWKKKWFKAKERNQQEWAQSQQAVIDEELGSTSASYSD